MEPIFTLIFQTTNFIYTPIENNESIMTKPLYLNINISRQN